MEEAGIKTNRRVPWRDWNRDPRGTAALTLFLIFAAIVLGLVAYQFYKSQVEFGLSYGTYVPTTLAVLVLVAGLASGWRTFFLLRRREQERLAAIRAGSLPERAKHAAEVLQEATTLVQELQDELTARTELLEDVRRRVEEASRRAEDMQKLSQVEDQTVRAVNNLMDQALKRRLDDLKREARQREWIIGTLVAFVVGIIVILVAHFVLSF